MNVMQVSVMALQVSIAGLIDRKAIEDGRVVYKGGWDPEAVLHTVCAFANDADDVGGGYILIGVEERDGMPTFPIKGTENDQITLISRELPEICNMIEPPYLPAVSYETVDDSNVVVIWAYRGNERPYSCPAHIGPAEEVEMIYCLRLKSETVRMSADRRPVAKTRRKYDEIRKEVLTILSDGKFIPISELSERMGYSNTTNSLRNVIRELVSRDMIEYNTLNVTDPGRKIGLKVA